MGNKVRNEDEAAFLHAESPGIPVLGLLPADMRVQEADRLGIPVYDHAPSLRAAAEKIVTVLTEDSTTARLQRTYAALTISRTHCLTSSSAAMPF